MEAEKRAIVILGMSGRHMKMVNAAHNAASAARNRYQTPEIPCNNL